MYCRTCGSSIDETLKYCKNCGAKLVKDDGDGKDATGKMLDDLLTTVCFVAIFGFAFLVGVVAILLDKIIAHELVVFIVVSYLVVLLGICFMLLREVPKLVNAKLGKKSEAEEAAAQPAQLFAENTAQLAEAREKFLTSVTENTTRTLGKVPAERS